MVDRTGSQMQFKGARPHNDGPLAVDDDTRAWPLVHAHKFADAWNEVSIVHHMPSFWNKVLVLPAGQSII